MDSRLNASWIGLADAVRLIAFVIGTDGIDGAVNATAPNPVRNADFSQCLNHTLRRPNLFSVPGFVLVPLGDFGREIILAGQRVLPHKALAHGFQFVHPALDMALATEIHGVLPRANARANPLLETRALPG